MYITKEVRIINTYRKSMFSSTIDVLFGLSAVRLYRHSEQKMSVKLRRLNFGHSYLLAFIFFFLDPIGLLALVFFRINPLGLLALGFFSSLPQLVYSP